MGPSGIDEAGSESVRRRKPEILAPAGDRDALNAALDAGADAVYFGLDEGFNARARARNFPKDELAEVVARIHRAGARACITMNTLVFEPELEHVEALILCVARSGADALIVQDPAVALIARHLCPQLEVHASTQMTISSPEAAAFAKDLGATRVVLPRELSVAEISRFVATAGIDTEVFVHGALCVSWSGQCQTSEAWSGRSANRGQCAQSCRMPYTAVVDGKVLPTGDVRYLLSPKDLSAFRAADELIDLGVRALKIEGRQKGPHYVATAVEAWRHQIDALLSESAAPDDAAFARDFEAMTLAYTRGFSDGWLAGSDHQTLVEGRFPKHRGALLGTVTEIDRQAVFVRTPTEDSSWTGALGSADRGDGPRGSVSAPLDGFGGELGTASGPRGARFVPRPGMGVVFDAGEPEDRHEPGGPIFGVAEIAGGFRLVFGTPGPDLSRVAEGQRVWLTSDPAAQQRTITGISRPEPEGRIAVDVVVRGAVGEPLSVTARARGATIEVASGRVAMVATGQGLEQGILEEKLLAFGGTCFRKGAVDLRGLAPGLFLPAPELKSLRRRLVQELLPLIERGAPRVIREAGIVAALKRGFTKPAASPAAETAHLVPLVRTDEQLAAVLAWGIREVELDWMELAGLGRAVERARNAGARVHLATLRIQKPGEEPYDGRLEQLAPDGVLVRHLGALMHFSSRRGGFPEVHGDFSLNVTNSITAHHLLSLGLKTLTPAFDLDAAQLSALLDQVPADRVTVPIYQRVPTFHTEHCVYAHLLSAGRDHHTCGRPCEEKHLELEDHAGRRHPVIVDVGCRNTVFNEAAQSSASLVPRLLAQGIRRFRVEFVRETAVEVVDVLAATSALVAGRMTPASFFGTLQVRDQQGISGVAMALSV